MEVDLTLKTEYCSSNDSLNQTNPKNQFYENMILENYNCASYPPLKVRYDRKSPSNIPLQVLFVLGTRRKTSPI